MVPDDAPGIVLAMGVAALLLAGAWLADVITQRAARGDIGVNHLIGLRLPIVLRSEASWSAGHRAASRVSRPTAVLVSIACCSSIALSSFVVGYLVCLGVAILALLGGTVTGGVLAARAAGREAGGRRSR